MFDLVRGNLIARSLNVVFACCSFIVCPTVSGGESSSHSESTAWQQHWDALRRHPDIVRYYTFESITEEGLVAESTAGESEPLTCVAKESIALVEGCCPGNKAVWLDQGYFQAKPFEVGDKGFTVEIRFRKHGQGTHLGNGRTNGMLFAQGDGYWNGLRVWTSYPSRNLRFEIGRPKPFNAFGLTAEGPVPDGVWHHVAATWDRREMRLYLNGVLLGAVAYDGDYTKPPTPLKIGYANAGIGSLKMDVDEVVVFGRALSPAEILRHAFLQQELTQDVEQTFLDATSAIARQDWSGAGEQFAKLVEMRDVSVEYRSAARLALAHTLRRRNKTHEAIAQYAALCDSTGVPESLREAAIRLCLPDNTRPVHAVASARVYERLLELDGLSPEEKISVRLCLADCYLRQNQPDSARKQYEAVLKTGLADRDALNVRLQMGHAHLAGKDYPAARSEYAKTASNAKAPPEFRGNAALCFAHTFVREKAYAQAAAVFAKVTKRTDLPVYQRWEAKQRMAEMQRLERGLPARDPAASRTKLAPTPVPGATFFVTSDGDDANPGTRDRPFATLQKARNAIRDLKSNGKLPRGGVTVLIRGGTYSVRQTFDLTEADSGTAEAPIVYRAFPGEAPVFVGGVRLDGFRPVTDSATLARLPDASRDKVLRIDLKEKGVTEYGSLMPRGYGLSGYPTNPWVDLYVDGRPMQLARWPNEGSVKVGKVHR